MTTIYYPVTRKALAKAYNITEKSLRPWLVAVGITHKKILSPAEVKKIINEYDLPVGIKINV